VLNNKLLAIIAMCLLITLIGCKNDNSPAVKRGPATSQQTAPQPGQIPSTKPQSDILAPLPPEWAQLKGFQPFFGDLDQIVKRRVIRALVAYNKTTYFVDGGTPHGIAYDMLKEFEKLLNKKLKLGKLGVHVLFIPVSKTQILANLAAGKGEIGIAGFAVTDTRQKLVDFTDPLYKNSSEIIVTGPGAPNITSTADLAGQEIFVRKGGSKEEDLNKLNEQFRKEGKKEIVIRFAPDSFEDEDILEMTNAGIMKITVADTLVGKFWKQIFSDITVHEDVAIRSGMDAAWAVRKNIPQLKAELNDFVKTHAVGTMFGNIVLNNYLKNIQHVKNSTSESEMKKYAELKAIFQKYGKDYAVDWLLMAAQGYQESKLDQNVKSPVGAIGIMQIMPSTGAELKVGDIRQKENNIHAGVKYMRFMINQYYKDEPMDLVNKMLFTFASYNAGPARIQGLRKVAAARGLDPNVWFHNVEYIAAEKIGQETVMYVANIYKYYIAYKLVMEQHVTREAEKQKLKKG
jgi:membrane-bound lytic murein transglycosylase MltF